MHVLRTKICVLFVFSSFLKKTRPPCIWHPRRQNGSSFGGATWWRPAVVYNPDDQLYHGFPVYLMQQRNYPPAKTKLYHVTHYTSKDLMNWDFHGFVDLRPVSQCSVLKRMLRVEPSHTGAPHCRSHCHARTAAPPLPIALPRPHCLFNTPHIAAGTGVVGGVREGYCVRDARDAATRPN